MKLLLSLLLAFTMSPVWPIGPNPLPGDPFLIVNKKSNEVAFIHDNKVQIVYKAATGKTNDLTPAGLYTVTVKAINPYYRKKNIPGGSPKNPLGSRWIGFNAKDTEGRTYGIHGTNNPSSIGGYVSQGCIRLKNEDAIELFEKVPIGTKIYITYSGMPFEEIAQEKGAITNH
ncbi:L,D-transpeptidase [Caldibacillus lycopersici]|uniref:L,D-transpeptidase n=1 Tax=Perspicuibacillus lycopersici TaxID=1325689 RepID=A0AAE3LMP6_9BACI|nr:L,D-transpeptidase [Perspicuibacillus lycopersici]MCU9613810.1 L,D-transpeptidase [Perspicuibacillus lycopersici]